MLSLRRSFIASSLTCGRNISHQSLLRDGGTAYLWQQFWEIRIGRFRTEYNDINVLTERDPLFRDGDDDALGQTAIRRAEGDRNMRHLSLGPRSCYK